MCGIAGFLESSPRSSPEVLREISLRMADTLRHRGPDDGGAWVDAEAGIALSMRRLAILDLSEAGHQPMQSASGRYVIVFNGEIYNCEDLRRELIARGEAPVFRGHSDTEVMLAAFESWGVLNAVQRFNGMFAFGLWDRRQRTLTLARDRFGEKPLFYGVVGGTFMFASELKALRAHPAFVGQIDVNAVALYLRHNCIPAPYSIYTDTRKLPPASLLTVSATDFAASPISYWSMREIAEAGLANPVHRKRKRCRQRARRAAARRRQDKDVLRRTAGRFSFGRHRLLHHCFVDAGADQSSGQDLFDWICRAQI